MPVVFVTGATIGILVQCIFPEWRIVMTTVASIVAIAFIVLLWRTIPD